MYFYPRSPCGERPTSQSFGIGFGIFLSTLSLRRATCYDTSISYLYRYFYPRSPCGERRPILEHDMDNIYISIHALLAESDLLQPYNGKPHRISIHALLAESDDAWSLLIVSFSVISIHALLAESDAGLIFNSLYNIHFYPRSPCGERLKGRSMGTATALFLSTLSLRRATPHRKVSELASAYFYPRSPCGERQLFINHFNASKWYFYPRSPCGERRIGFGMNIKPDDFYPRSPCGERLILLLTQRALNGFLSTLSLRRATSFNFYFGFMPYDFYPRSPCGERRYDTSISYLYR